MCCANLAQTTGGFRSARTYGVVWLRLSTYCAKQILWHWATCLLLFIFFRSLSFVLALASMAYFLLILLYITIDVCNIWSGTPFFYPGERLFEHQVAKFVETCVPQKLARDEYLWRLTSCSHQGWTRSSCTCAAKFFIGGFRFTSKSPWLMLLSSPSTFMVLQSGSCCPWCFSTKASLWQFETRQWASVAVFIAAAYQNCGCWKGQKEAERENNGRLLQLLTDLHFSKCLCAHGCNKLKFRQCVLTGEKIVPPPPFLCVPSNQTWKHRG